MSTTLGGTAVPTPVKYPHRADEVVVQRRMANGTLRSSVIAHKRAWTLEWKAVTEAQKDTLWGRFTAGSAIPFVDEDSDSYTVHISANSWNCEPITLAVGRRYNVGFAVIEV